MQESNRNTTEQLQPLMTIPKVAAFLSVSRPTVYELINTQGLPTMKLGRSVRVDPGELKQWLAQCAQPKGR